jgi:hypothetical protein
MPSSISSSDALAAARRKHDERLISLAKNPSDRRFLTTITATFVVLTVCWAIAVPHMPKTFPALNQGEMNRAEIIDFERSPPRPVALAGTSLMRRVMSEYFSHDVANIALAGESTVTSASIGASKEPSILVIEINILDRGSETRGLLPAYFSTTPVRGTAASIFDLDKVARVQSDRIRNEGKSIITGAPADPASNDSVVLSIRGWAKRKLLPELNRKSGVELTAIANGVEARGGKVFYVLLPVHPALQQSPYYRRGYNFLRAEDPNFDRRFLAIDWSDEIRWDPDGAHVDGRSAIVVAHQIESALSKYLD